MSLGPGRRGCSGIPSPRDDGHVVGVNEAQEGKQKRAHSDTLSETEVGLTLKHTNQTILVEGPAITIRPFGTRRRSECGVR